MTVIRYSCEYSSHGYVCIEVNSSMASAMRGGMTVLCSECGKEMDGSFLS